MFFEAFTKHTFSFSYVLFFTKCLKNELECFIDKTRAASFLNSSKNIPGKACVNRVHNNNAFVNVGN